MPALVLFGRRSRVGSDDLYCPALLLLLYQLPFVLLSVCYISLWRNCSSMSFSSHGIPFWFVLGAIPIYGFMGCVYLMVMHVSSKGTIVEYERRMLMPRLLQMHVLWSALMLCYGISGIVFWYNLELCFPDAHFVLAISGAMVAEVSFTLMFGFCILGGAPSHSGASHPHYHDASERSAAHYGTTACASPSSKSHEQRSLLAELDRAIPNSDVYVPHQQRWEKWCQSLCACVRCATCNLFGGSGTQHDSMSVVANVLARLFYGSPDLVISDIVAGFILLAAVQAHEEEEEQVARLLLGKSDGTTLSQVASSADGVATLRELRQRLKTDAGYGGHTSSSTTGTGAAVLSPPVSSAHDTSGYVAISMPSPESPSSLLYPPEPGSPPLPPSTTEQDGDHDGEQEGEEEEDASLSATMEELAHFSKYAVGIYGWMLYVWSHPWTATFRLAFSCMKTNHHYIHGDNLFHLGQAALQLETKIKSHDIVYASFKNTVYRPAFCVVLDHARKEVVVAIRGTLSLEDCLTDAIAYGKPLDELAQAIGCDEARGEYAHQGFLHCAEEIYYELNRLGVLQMLFDPNSQAQIALDQVNGCEPGEFCDYGLMVTGHSLGSATSVLLAIMLRPKFPNLRCFAYSPPGCTLSPGLAQKCESFVTSVVVGHDIVARTSLTSAEELRDQVIDLIGRSKVGKSAILRQVISWKKPHELLHDHDHDGPLAGVTAIAAENVSLAVTVAAEPPGFSAHLANYRTMLQRIQTSEPIHPLVLPGKVIHLTRTNELLKNAGCWVCCRPGSGGICCTERTNYGFQWSSRDKFSKIRIARTMLDDHFPDKVHHVLQDCATRLRKKNKKNRKRRQQQLNETSKSCRSNSYSYS